ncbi:GNAT family N-acetyltransferase [Spiractinospora alimapuensis]|uniref:GNAT family N-acetyltransferase n=1 Tax=Spiractinospora alimapuensis TaxID=2820884 RepID=UPI001F2B31E9|nr:GNAT family N-acetyltransferase [Spiractinospora alimapuensis]QVQ52845.1 GNAT family N-acetyltransferase [Spiractinospora alimapuensis]
MTNHTYSIRAATTDDADAIREIACLAEPEDAATATELTAALNCAVFVDPYLTLDPDLVFVADDGTRPVGYVLGTGDTPTFVGRYRAEYLPEVAPRLPLGEGEPITWDEKFAWLLHNPEYMLLEDVSAYPAHLHVNLLPGHTRAGLGRELVARFVDALRERRVGGVHLATALDNIGGQAFFHALGFQHVEADLPASFFVRDTAPI